MKRFFSIFSIGFLLSVFAGGCSSPGEEGVMPAARPQAVEVARVERRDMSEILRVVGSIAANESVEIRPETTGQIREVAFYEGQWMEAGQAVVRLDDREIQARIRETNVRLELARQSLERADALWANRSIPQADRDRALAEFERTKAELDLLNVLAQRTVVPAPFQGVVGTRLVSPGDLVGPGDVITRIDDLSSLKIEFTVPERFADRVKPDSRVVARASGLRASDHVEGKVYFVSSSIDRQTRSIEVKAMTGELNGVIRPGTFVEVELILEERVGALTVPESAILFREGRSHVVAVRKDDSGQHLAALRPVTLGIREPGRVEIIPDPDDPVAEGDMVVGSGVGALPLFPGALLDPVPMKTIPNRERAE